MSKDLSFSSGSGNSSYNDSAENVCLFQHLSSFDDFSYLIHEKSCHKHSSLSALFLCFANFVIFLFGVSGNTLVIYFISFKTARLTASSMFICNLALADLFVILFCIPSTMFASIFKRTLQV